VYDTILSGLEAQQSEVLIESYLMAKISCSLETLVLYVRMDNPGLFYVDFQKYHFAGRFPHRTIVFSYLYPTPQIESVERKITDKIKGIIRSNNISQLTPYEKELSLHDYLVTNVAYEYADKSYHKAHSAVGALLHGRAVCEGYSMAFKLLCDAAGISCIVLYGTATNSDGTGNHAWNIVKLDGKCYHIDVTWDGCTKTETTVSHNCFNLTDDDIGQDHIWDRELLPNCTSTEDNYFVRRRVFFTSSEELKHHFVSELKKGQRNFSVKLNRKFKDHTPISHTLKEAMKSMFLTNPLGYSFQIQYDSVRDVANISVATNF
jgi:hypothetical protein